LPRVSVPLRVRESLSMREDWPIAAGVDGFNLRTGGGVTHLRELLETAEPECHGIRRVVLWTGEAPPAQVPDRPWLRANQAWIPTGGCEPSVRDRTKGTPRLQAADRSILYRPPAGRSF